jgi:hypothetical protein
MASLLKIGEENDSQSNRRDIICCYNATAFRNPVIITAIMMTTVPVELLAFKLRSARAGTYHLTGPGDRVSRQVLLSTSKRMSVTWSSSSIPVAPILGHRASVKHFVSLQFLILRQSAGLSNVGLARRKAALRYNTMP